MMEAALSLIHTLYPLGIFFAKISQGAFHLYKPLYFRAHGGLPEKAFAVKRKNGGHYYLHLPK
jgi:hypothetical protein